MEDPLQEIRNEHPNLTPTETYELLCKALLPEVAEENVDHAAFTNALNQYEGHLNDLLLALGDRERPQSAEELIDEDAEQWLYGLELDAERLDPLLRKIREIADAFPEKDSVEEMVDERIKSDYPQFHKKYLEHQEYLERQESLKADEERLASQEQGQLQDEPAPGRNSDHLQKIRAEYPYLNPTETYALLREAVMPEVLNIKSLFTGLEQCEALLDRQPDERKDGEKPQSVEGLLEQRVEEWFKALRAEHRDLDSLFESIQDVASNLPDKARREEMVNERIQADYPQFHTEYLQHQQWLKINQERLARQEQRQSQREQDQTHSQDGHTR